MSERSRGKRFGFGFDGAGFTMSESLKQDCPKPASAVFGLERGRVK